MQIASGWDNTNDTIQLERKKDPPHVSASNFKLISGGKDKRYVYPPELRKLTSFCIASEYLQSMGEGSKRKARGSKRKRRKDND